MNKMEALQRCVVLNELIKTTHCVHHFKGNEIPVYDYKGIKFTLCYAPNKGYVNSLTVNALYKMDHVPYVRALDPKDGCFVTTQLYFQTDEDLRAVESLVSVHAAERLMDQTLWRFVDTANTFPTAQLDPTVVDQVLKCLPKEQVRAFLNKEN